MTKEFIIWKKKWATGIKSIDEQHLHFVGIINRTALLNKTGEDGDKLKLVLNDLTEYARVHFSTEEEYFDETKYPETRMHKQKHLELLQRVLEFDKRFEAKKDEKEHVKLVKDFLDFLKNWLDEHLIKVDHEYVPWLKEHGIK